MNMPSPLPNTCVLLVALPGQTAVTTSPAATGFSAIYKGCDGATAVTPIFVPSDLYDKCFESLLAQFFAPRVGSEFSMMAITKMAMFQITRSPDHPIRSFACGAACVFRFAPKTEPTGTNRNSGCCCFEGT